MSCSMARQRMDWSICAWSGKLFLSFFLTIFTFSRLLNVWPVHVPCFPARDEKQTPEYTWRPADDRFYHDLSEITDPRQIRYLCCLPRRKQSRRLSSQRPRSMMAIPKIYRRQDLYPEKEPTPMGFLLRLEQPKQPWPIHRQNQTKHHIQTRN